MTVGIGVLCSGGNHAIIASDTRGSYGPGSTLSNHDQISKQFDLWPKFNLHSCVAGDASPCQTFVSEFYEKSKNDLPEPSKAQLVNFIQATRETQWYVWEPLVNHELKFQLAMTRQEWISSKAIGAALYEKGQKLIKSVRLPVHFIVGGFLGTGRPLLMRMMGTDDVEEEVNFTAIGHASGAFAATEHLNRRGQEVHLSLARTLLHISEAMIKARRATRSVGNPSAYSVITSTGAWRFPQDSELLREWRRKYRHNSAQLDNDGAAQQETLKLLIPHVSPHAKWSAPQM